MRSVNLPARIAFALFGPRTNTIESAMLLFPEPFGPVMDVYPWRKGIEIFRPNDLKFSIWISFRNKVSPDRWKVSAGARCHYPSHLFPSGVRLSSDEACVWLEHIKALAAPSEQRIDKGRNSAEVSRLSEGLPIRPWPRGRM